jgi:hypothetical protein
MKVTCFTSATTSFGLHTALISSLLLFAASCSGQGHPCIEHQRTIDRGVYGEAVYITPENQYTPLYNVPIKINGFGSQLTIETRTNEDGLYEFELADTMTYSICAEFATSPCQTFSAASLLVRMDLVVYEGLIYWDDARYGECP